ncbi:MAG: LLM class flavin-dependent oxidoreductase [Actinobacteria bacterium]|nr:LLM class flavin-dependent oxidoreductase [Actinomycetota bacterium]
MKVGVFLPPLENAYEDGGTVRWADLAEMARLAEDVGFDSVWVPDHFLFRFPGVTTFGVWECWSLVSALAAVTNRLEIGTMVSVTLWRSPGLLAKILDTVDEISGGRIIAGLGAGSHEAEFPAFGYQDWNRRVTRFEEEIAILHTLLKTGRVDHVGRFHTLKECELRPRGPRDEGPPIMIGAREPRMIRIAATYADEWNIPWRNDVSELIAESAKGDDACREVGRDPATLRRSACLHVDLPNRDDYPGSELLRQGRVGALKGNSEELAETLTSYADAGISMSSCGSIQPMWRASRPSRQY